jgi:hypothetical protein
MSIWGEADANEIPDDPFHIEPNWYPAVAVECYEKEVDAAEGSAILMIKWKIQQPGSQFDGLPVPDRNNFFKRPNDQLSGDQIQRNSFTKKKIREAFDLTPDQVQSFSPKNGLGKKAMIEVTNNPDRNNPDIVYNNVRSAISQRLYEERYGDAIDDAIDKAAESDLLDAM